MEEPKKKKPLWLKLVIIVFTVLLLAIVVKILSSEMLEKKLGKNTQDNCKNNHKPIFTANFTNLNRLTSIAPIGAINAGSPGRSYVFADTSNNRELIPIYSPADATLEGIVFARRNPKDPNAPGEYRLDLRVSCEVTFSFDHLDEVSDAIKKLAPSTPNNNTREPTKTSLSIKAGELIAYTNGTDMSGGFDFYLLNSTVKADHINPKRWNWEQSTIADCPYDYFTEDLKSNYYAMLKSHDNQPLLKLSCGSPSHDIKGTASGGWFQGNSTDQNGKWLEIGNANGKTELLIRESGQHMFSVRDYNTKPLPDELTVGRSVCYSEQGKWAFIKVDSDEKLSLAKGEGSCPSNFPSAGIEEWER